MKYLRPLCALVALALPAISPLYAENLLEIYQLAEKHDATYRAAKYTFEAAEQNEPIALGALLPLIQANASQSWNHVTSNIPEDFSVHNFSISATQVVFDFSAFKTYTQSQIGVKQAAITYAQAAQDLIMRTATAYFNVLKAEDDLRYAKANEKQTREQMLQAEHKYQVGLAAQTDALTAEASYEAAVATREAADNTVSDAIEDLAVITGKHITHLAKLQHNFPLVHPNPANPQKWVNTALSQNLSLQVTEMQAKYDKENIQIQRGAWFPTVNVSGAYSTGALVTPGSNLVVSNETADVFTGSVNLTYNLYTGGNTYFSQKQAKMTYKADELNTEESQREITSQMRSGYLTVFSDISQVIALRQAVISGESALKAARAAYYVGTRTIVDLLEEQSTLFSTQQQYAAATYNYITDSLQMKEIAGLLSVKDIVAVNQWLRDYSSLDPSEEQKHNAPESKKQAKVKS